MLLPNVIDMINLDRKESFSITSLSESIRKIINLKAKRLDRRLYCDLSLELTI
jgi:hypothetical protein